jgi:hypothetical protein
MTQYCVLPSEGRQRYIYTKTHKNIQEKKEKKKKSFAAAATSPKSKNTA